MARRLKSFHIASSDTGSSYASFNNTRNICFEIARNLLFVTCDFILNIFVEYRGKKKLEKVLFQSQQDVMHLTEKLVGVQSGIFALSTVVYAVF